MFKKFNDFLGETFTYTQIPFDVINEALTDDCSKDHKFGICMTTYKIGGDDGGVQQHRHNHSGRSERGQAGGGGGG